MSHMVQIGLPDLQASACAANHRPSFKSLCPDSLFSLFFLSHFHLFVIDGRGTN